MGWDFLLSVLAPQTDDRPSGPSGRLDQRNLKAIGTFAYQAVERKNPRYVEYIPDTLAYIKRNRHRYDDFAPYRQVLARYLPFDER